MLFPNIDPIAINLGTISIHWYGIAYVVGIILGTYIMQQLEERYKIAHLTSEDFDRIVIYIVIGIIVGGRMGEVIFYMPHLVINDFFEVFKIWHGGMSFHGGVIGIIVTIWMFSVKYKKYFLRVTDLIACAAPVGLFFGRIANFVNAELYGKRTEVAWGVIFPGTDFYPRHPSQLYEAFAEGILLLSIMLIVVKIENIRKYKGRISGVFLIFYSIFRIVIELFREPDAHIGYIMNIITLGQSLSIPMLILGTYLYLKRDYRQ
nr:prolipoprotein diacylglyceryl transferase [Candidatus Bandiella woodruffii]